MATDTEKPQQPTADPLATDYRKREESITYTAETAGTVTEIKVKPGDAVGAGDVVVVIGAD